MALAKKNGLLYRLDWMVFGLLAYDVLTIVGSYLIAIYICSGFDLNDITQSQLVDYKHSIPWMVLGSLLIYSQFKLYNSIWRRVSYYELCSFSFAAVLTVVLYMGVGLLCLKDLTIHYYIVGGWLQAWMLLVSRFFYRFLFGLWITSRNMTSQSGVRRRAMLIGAGSSGQIILRDVLQNNNSQLSISCIIDDDPQKLHCRMNGIPIVGGREDIMLNVAKYGIEEILLAIPTLSAVEKRNVINICNETGCKLRVLPNIYSLANGDVSLMQMREVSVEELLGREPIQVAAADIENHLSGKIVLVTGGGGSIGSELCRQIAKNKPSQLLVFDIYENNAYDIEQELKRKFPELNLLTLIGSVRDSKRLKQIFEEYQPEIVFHAAAHKHVPLMETSPCEAIKNNVLGTYKTACMAMFYGCKRFVLVSTDKAVNPTNIMGASKRLCEMVIQTLDRINQAHGKVDLLEFLSEHQEPFSAADDERIANSKTRTEFVAVRFGNVLGSNGSVIPLFKKQIANGGPLTVTHPDIIRYFMTIPEAVSLVLQAATYAKGGEIFVLDMGEPVKIDTLARNLIKLSGKIPDVDIKIEYSGLRPGEKLFEEKLMSEEGLLMTQNKLIHVAKPLNWDIDEFMTALRKLAEVAYVNEKDIRTLVKGIVKTYKEK
ncbi:MAG: nucleoside-diphosphate sugar epimerase/dehydratase [Victivallaceae bacterium]